MTDLRSHDWGADPIFDSAVMSHGFTPYMRDYDVIAEVPAARPDGNGSYIESRYRYRFTHCVEAIVKTTVPPDTWRESWCDEFIDFSAWEQAGKPDGFVWGVEWAMAYPGVEYMEASHSAATWAGALDKPMHGIRIETNAYVIELVCHGLVVTRLAMGDPVTGELRPVD